MASKRCVKRIEDLERLSSDDLVFEHPEEGETSSEKVLVGVRFPDGTTAPLYVVRGDGYMIVFWPSE